MIEIAPGVPVMDAEAASPTALAAIKVAAQYLGTSYHFGGASPETGFDCSGLMQWAYSHAGVSIPRVTYDQIDVGTQSIAPTWCRATSSSSSTTATCTTSACTSAAAASCTRRTPGDVVKVSSLDEPYYAEQFAGGRRMA